MKEPLFGKILNELIIIVKEAGLPAFTARQIAEWLYKHKAGDIDDMTNLSKRAREGLKQKFTVGHEAPAGVMESIDGTKKYLERNNYKSIADIIGKAHKFKLQEAPDF